MKPHVLKMTRCVSNAMDHAVQPPSGGGPGSMESRVRMRERVRERVVVTGCCFCVGVVDLVGVRSGGDGLLEWWASRSRFELSCIVEAVKAVEGDMENERFFFSSSIVK